jgi:AraC-like DNA-binding protein
MRLNASTFAGLCRARDLLYEVHDEPLTVEEVARAACISPAHFIRLFDAVFGRTPHQFRIDARLDHARRLLARGEHSVTDVCMAVGFSSLGSFSDLFTRRIGASPSAWRRRIHALAPSPAALPGVLYPGCLSLMGRLPASAFSQFSRSVSPPARSDFRNAYQADKPHGR